MNTPTTAPSPAPGAVAAGPAPAAPARADAVPAAGADPGRAARTGPLRPAPAEPVRPARTGPVLPTAARPAPAGDTGPALPRALPTGEDGRKRTVEGVVVKVLLHARDDRGMTLELFASRCVRAGELHELVTTDQCAAALGDRIDRVGFLGFAEITRAGVIDRGDVVRIAGEPVGTVLGFDACHVPNHYNILIAAPARRTGRTLGLAPESAVTFAPAVEPSPAPMP